jgi:menaquinone-dependent protoporphyrinogen IX oxidase
MNALVVFDSKHGTTKEAADRIADALGAQGDKAELLDLRKGSKAASPLEGFDAVALGAPFYMGSWSKKARSFAAANADELARKAIGVFAVGADPKLGDKAAIAALPASVASSVAASTYLGGRVKIASLSGFERFIVKMVGGKAEDYSSVDFGPIGAFAAALAGKAGKN